MEVGELEKKVRNERAKIVKTLQAGKAPSAAAIAKYFQMLDAYRRRGEYPLSQEEAAACVTASFDPDSLYKKEVA